jgi:hypothetical protein
MQKWIVLWLTSLVVMAVVASGVTAWFVQRTTPQPAARASNGLPWAMGAKRVQQVAEGTAASGIFINLPVNCGPFSMAKAVLVADEAFIRRVGNTRDVNTELRGNVYLRYTALHD